MVDEHHLPHLLAGLEGIRHRVGREIEHRASAIDLRVRGSEGRILDLIGDGGARPTELSDGAWISKQAIGKRIRGLTERGLVDVDPDPDDGRAVVVTRTPLGDQVWSTAMDAIAGIERDFAVEVGRDRYDVFRDVLDELASGFVPGPSRVNRLAGGGFPP